MAYFGTSTSAIPLSQIMPRRPSSNQVQLCALLAALERGERLTVKLALERYGIYALSQRVGDLKLLGWPIQSERVELGVKCNVCEYWL